MHIQSTSVKDQVYNEIKRRILVGQYPFGFKININALANEFGVSNSPIREACSRLENDYLITYSTNAGARVIMMNEQLYLNIADTMSILQQGSYMYCLQRDRKELLVEIMTNCLESVRIATQAEDKSKTLVSDNKYWSSFIEATGNHRFLEISKKTFDLYQLSEIYNHRNVTLNYPAIFLRDQKLLEHVINDDYAEVTKSIFTYKIYHPHN